VILIVSHLSQHVIVNGPRLIQRGLLFSSDFASQLPNLVVHDDKLVRFLEGNELNGRVLAIGAQAVQIDGDLLALTDKFHRQIDARLRLIEFPKGDSVSVLRLTREPRG
jgi:hypothetical protein